jgi:hypothetical protein
MHGVRTRMTELHHLLTGGAPSGMAVHLSAGTTPGRSRPVVAKGTHASGKPSGKAPEPLDATAAR